MFPIYIPSKNRVNTIAAAGLLADDGVPFTLVVEPQDEEAYKAKFGTDIVTVLPENDQGLAYSRECIREISRLRGEPWHWHINDDIRRFILREPGAGTKTLRPSQAIAIVENDVNLFSNIALAGMEENLWPPHSTPRKINALPAQSILINNSVRSKFREFPGFDDIDFLLQILEEGWCSFSLNHVRIIAPTPGTNCGGSFGVDRASWGERFMAQWSHVEFNPGGSPGGRPNQRWINKTYKQRPELKLPKRPNQ